jgi:uncharacterized protein (TIGR03118 family)
MSLYKTYTLTNLISDGSVSAPNTDSDLLNPWGMLIINSTLWIANNHSGYLTNYSLVGTKIGSNIYVPPPTLGTFPSTPTGIVQNLSTGFPVNSVLGGPSALIIIVTEDGTISAYTPTYDPYNAYLVSDRNASSDIYKGITFATYNGEYYIYLADFHNGVVRVFDSTWTLQSQGFFPFVDPTLPLGYAPFNVVYLNGLIYVLYALQDSAQVDDVSGLGNGYVSIFQTNGVFVQRFISGGVLNSPWSMIPAPNFVECEPGSFLIGNFGNGIINIFDPLGNYLGPWNYGTQYFTNQLQSSFTQSSHTQSVLTQQRNSNAQQRFLQLASVPQMKQINTTAISRHSTLTPFNTIKNTIRSKSSGGGGGGASNSFNGRFSQRSTIVSTNTFANGSITPFNARSNSRALIAQRSSAQNERGLIAQTNENALVSTTGAVNQPIIIQGLWSLLVYNGAVYFSSGPNFEANGLVGIIRPNFTPIYPSPCCDPCYKSCCKPCCDPCYKPCYKPCCKPCYKPCCDPCYKPCCDPCCNSSYEYDWWNTYDPREYDNQGGYDWGCKCNKCRAQH